MTQINDTSKFEAEHAKRQFEALHRQTRVSLLRCIDSAIEALDEARRALLNGRSTTGSRRQMPSASMRRSLRSGRATRRPERGITPPPPPRLRSGFSAA